MKFALRLGLIMMLLAIVVIARASTPLSFPPVRIGVLLDGESEMSRQILSEVQNTILEFFGTSAELRFDAVYVGDWTSGSARSNAERALNDRTVDIVLALGPITSQELCLLTELKKPAIACFVIDAGWQGLPAKAGASGVKNLTYLNASLSARRSLEEFRKVVPFRNIAILLSDGLLASIPQLVEEGIRRGKQQGIEITYVEVGSSASVALQKLPPGVEAVYLTPLLQLSATSFDSLVATFTARRLPSFSHQGRRDVERGALASYAPNDDLLRRSRRIASNIQRIMSGEDAGTLSVDFSSDPYLTINMATARTIGFSPPWMALSEAELLNEETTSGARTVTLEASAKEAISANLTLQAAMKMVESGAQEVLKARAPLLPQISAAATAALVPEDVAEASFGMQPQRTFDGTVGFSQILYADHAWANYSIQSSLQTGRQWDQKGTELDVTLRATTAYLNVLRAKALSRVQRSNLKLTLSNLELARIRQNIGSSSMSDVYRWESQVATSRKSVLDAEAQVKLTEIELNRMLNRPLEETFRTEEKSLEDSTLLRGERRIFRYVENPLLFEAFRRFMVTEGMLASPELQQLAAAIDAQERAHSAASRSLWLPSFTLQGGLKDLFAKGGAGTTAFGSLPTLDLNVPQMPDFSWRVELQASLPIFLGLGRIATLDQTNIELERLRIQYQAAGQVVGQRVLASLQRTATSYASIAQANAAAIAAAKNLDLVKEAYSEGAVPIVTLIDAQNAALTANEGVSNALYNFLIDLMNVERSVGQFDFLRTADQQAAFFERLETFFSKAGLPLNR